MHAGARCGTTPRCRIVYGRCSEIEGSRREVNPGGNPELRRYVTMMRIEMTRAYAMKPAPRPPAPPA